MTTYSYNGFDSAGGARKGLIEATDLKRAREKLMEGGIIAGTVSPVRLRRRRRFACFSCDFPISERSRFYRELLALVQAGLPLAKSLDLLILSPGQSDTTCLLASVRDSVNEGASLADALSGASSSVSPYEKAVISAGERVGVLDTVLERLADFMDEQSRLRESLFTAMAYPVIVFFIATAMAIGLLGFAVPRIGDILQEEANLSLPWLTRIVIGLGHFVVRWGLPLLIVIPVGFLLGARRIRNDAALKLKMDRMAFSLPVLGRGYALLVNLRFARTISLLLAGDVELMEGVKLSGEATGSVWIRSMSEQAAESIRHGSSLADALQRIPPFAGSLARWARVGEAGAQLAKLLDCAGVRFQMQWEDYISRLTRMIEPALIIAVGIFVLIAVISIILPMLSLNTLV